MTGDWMSKITHSGLKSWIEEVIALVSPKDVRLCDGSEAEYQQLCQQMQEAGVMTLLNPELHPNCFLVRSSPDDVARVEQFTFICTKTKEEAGPTNNWRDPQEMRAELHELFQGCMQGRTLYIVPFCMGPLHSPFSLVGIEITDSPYVVCSMKIMTRMGASVLEMLGSSGTFYKCLHSVGKPLAPGEKDVAWPCNPGHMRIVHFQDDSSVMSFGSGYGGNALLGKKCVALRLASYLGHKQGWLAEHMLVIGVTNPEGRKKYFAAAFPSACGKTNLAMLMPKLPGWKVECIGDDIAWIRPGDDGRLYAVNPEFGFFGVAIGTSEKTNPNALATCHSDSIFTNVALTSDGDVWWEGKTATPPQGMIDWKGRNWTPGGEPAAHPNARFTAPLDHCPSLDPQWDSPQGVPLEAIIFGGRRTETIPLVYESLSWEHGVMMGAGMSSTTTAAIAGELGKLRHDPFAMLPFCGYNMAAYFEHWLSFAGKGLQLPRIFSVNWFRKDENGQFIWPGFSENLRVLEWIFRRTDGEDSIARRTPIGYLPTEEGLNTTGLNLSRDALQSLLAVDTQGWRAEVNNIREYCSIFGSDMPRQILEELSRIENELK
ncbi:phosphoenolpyruvate carboxykinase [Chlamydia muridarum str. Nigg]|jgi:Phosphoenolpyruvate carboxykinase (GTP)|uniref:Phosphoenolpyruvate carboxykinase [GTP] n=2 Tax=Chlamydia muridarum TaxID=83560 RepID=PCKG_CHLMU|nr:phosphoenolpyruvate carboxykinase (GTP) [Chlamydia muridarum]Q9PLL6.1 RecName: Full=Phosphoenolpyruvate carboxykinase [GTP]; Short=PEP carboxykinase; Short=PEPCK [Chlamydia muridarum str. Nigg]UFX35281.1 phosphoenolpyruvate carboxykinase (GTP) [Chlamydia trachomatis]AAF73531.1 phosphoenolpyruvate carboxykinase [Chlamydia muridarum str. Nigg]AHH22481.1 phosphoenolpyruvate carboxykinase [Chlamydia muridarum str. Nigg3 CMUT3-5]AHH23405.1 phosphoenolpyruvate carboxykinase [Chlamydia muridarum s